MAFGFSGGSAENIRPRPPLREDFAIIREEPNLRVAFADDPEEEYEVERIDSQGNATVVGSSSSPDILVPSQAREHRVVAKNKELGIRGTPSVPKKELKPTHRWQMRLPRNLLESNDSGSATNFDPASTAWQTRGDFTYGGTVSNVGPNGETAHLLDTTGSDTDLEDGLIQKISYPAQPFTWGLLVRTVSGTCDVRFGFNNQAGNSTDYAITTDWQFITHTDADFSQSGGGLGNVHIYYNPFGDNGGALANLYVLRAGLNRGSSLEYSTRSQVPQTIPDVVQGADLSNGSTSGADTNDLSFAVDADGVPYAVSDGDDQASGTVLKGNGTIAISYYVSSSSSVDKGVILKVNTNNFQIAPRRDRNGFRIVVKDPQGNDILLRTGGLGSSTQDAWQQAIITRVNDTDLRFNFNGTELSYSFNQKYDDSDLKIFVADGRRVRQVETHPVLSEAEAEAVRQRLATNPADPVAVTEAWDTSVGSGDTLPAKRQPTNDITVGADVGWASPIGLEDLGGGSLLDDARHPTGSITRIHRLQSAQGPLMGRTVNGWVVTDTDLVVEDESGQTASSTHGLTLADDAPHVLAVVIDKEQSEARLYADGSPTPAATVGLSQVGALKSGDVNLLPNGGAITHPVVFTRVLTGEEASYAMQRLDDFSEEPFPEYVRP